MKSTKHSKKRTRNNKIDKILSKVSDIIEYAIDNQMTQPAQMEELEWMLNRYVK